MAKGLEGNEDLHPVIQLARDAIEGYLKEGKRISPPEELTPDMREKAGVFVCLKKGGELRGCIGTFQSTTDSIAEEIIQNAVSAATDDPRFSCVEFHELKDIACSVDVLTEPVAVADLKELDPKRYGVIVASGRKRGLLLPDLEGVDTVEYQLDIAMRKAGIRQDEPISVFKFEVKRYE